MVVPRQNEPLWLTGSQRPQMNLGSLVIAPKATGLKWSQTAYW